MLTYALLFIALMMLLLVIGVWGLIHDLENFTRCFVEQASPIREVAEQARAYTQYEMNFFQSLCYQLEKLRDAVNRAESEREAEYRKELLMKEIGKATSNAYSAAHAAGAKTRDKLKALRAARLQAIEKGLKPDAERLEREVREEEAKAWRKIEEESAEGIRIDDCQIEAYVKALEAGASEGEAQKAGYAARILAVLGKAGAVAYNNAIASGISEQEAFQVGWAAKQKAAATKPTESETGN